MKDKGVGVKSTPLFIRNKFNFFYGVAGLQKTFTDIFFNFFLCSTCSGNSVRCYIPIYEITLILVDCHQTKRKKNLIRKRVNKQHQNNTTGQRFSKNVFSYISLFFIECWIIRWTIKTIIKNKPQQINDLLRLFAPPLGLEPRTL